jgi:hypothetical protein
LLCAVKYVVLIYTMINFAACFAVYGCIAVAMLAYYKSKFAEKGADITPFLALFTLETIAWLAIVLS